ncbi:MAG TPA: agmatinase [Candidatus Avacidaminococcus intestinavium]|uniref:Agmatinase n=1 Tax=Candidatus Avacidaminococcus intestinavium TaxID=2840684 RepID=A0A9D1MN76_9FIRM|nr:agmatinase [Candidatus Avacidaminococcus intestinavium]
MNKNVETFIGCDKDYLAAKVVLFGAPFDSTTSFRPGTRFASKVMRGDSFGIETYSPYQDKDLVTDTNVFDAGDLELPFGNTQRVLQEIEAFTANILDDDKVPVMIGGEHLVTLGAVRAVSKKYPDLHIIHFDAHTDLREDYLGESLSHATVIRRVWELVGDDKINQFGIRSGEKEEFVFAAEHNFINKFNLHGLEDVVKKLAGKPVYFTLDLDVLDPSIFPGTGTPEAGGISFSELLNGVLSLSGLNIVGCDVNELSPVYDHSGTSTAVACKILREILLVMEARA